MKKLLILMTCVWCVLPAFAQEKGRLYVAPFRETYFNYPSELVGDDYTVTIYLPEEAVPLKKPYPVVYFMGLPRTERENAQQFAQDHQLILVGVSIDEKDLQRLKNKLEAFLTRDIIPYIDTNYYTDREHRILALGNGASLPVFLPLLERGNEINRLFVNHPQESFENCPSLPPTTRVLVSGFQNELALASAALKNAGLTYGTGFVAAYAPYQDDFLSNFNSDYLFATTEQVTLKKIMPRLGSTLLPLTNGASVSLTVDATLQNDMQFAAIPEIVKTSPPFLDWQDMLGVLTVRAGAEPGPVHLEVFVDKTAAKQKITLKKQ